MEDSIPIQEGTYKALRTLKLRMGVTLNLGKTETIPFLVQYVV